MLDKFQGERLIFREAKHVRSKQVAIAQDITRFEELCGNFLTIGSARTN